MSLSNALNIARSGLSASARGAAIISENIANAQTEGYGRRSLRLNSDTVSGGVQIAAVERQSDPAILARRRSAESSQESAKYLANFHGRVETLFAGVGETDSLSARMGQFESDLRSAANRPEAEVRLANLLNSTKALATAINGAAEGVAATREEADAQISSGAELLRASLANVQDLNTKIATSQDRSGSLPGLLDQRQIQIDKINALVSVHQFPRDNGTVALYSKEGTALLDGQSPSITFAPTPTISTAQTLSNERLSGISINGSDVTNRLSGGTLEAAFMVRDSLTPARLEQLNAFAYEIADRFVGPDTDDSLSIGQAGIFVLDDNNPAQSLSVNRRINPTEGGALWRLRDGIEAQEPGLVGDATILNGLLNAVLARQLPDPSLGTASINLAEAAQNLVSETESNRLSAEAEVSFSVNLYSEFRQIELSHGVDTDQELEQLLVIERAYAANARVLQTVDEMMQSLLRI